MVQQVGRLHGCNDGREGEGRGRQSPTHLLHTHLTWLPPSPHLSMQACLAISAISKFGPSSTKYGGPRGEGGPHYQSVCVCMCVSVRVCVCVCWGGLGPLLPVCLWGGFQPAGVHRVVCGRKGGGVALPLVITRPCVLLRGWRAGGYFGY